MFGSNTKESQEEKPAAIRLLLVENHELILAGMRALLQSNAGLKVVGEARNATEVLDGMRLLPDVVLMELDLGPDNGLDILETLQKLNPRPRVLVVTASQNRERHVQAACKGAMGIVQKQHSVSQLMNAIRKVHSGELWLNRSMMAEAMTNLQQQTHRPDPESQKINSLTTRERSVIALLGEGLRNKEIGERLSISDKTVRHHLSSVFGKLRLKDRQELMIFSYQHGLARFPARRNAAHK
jgi:two-component system, NarL family, nitrate/nitrite response regulator NarL